MTKQEVIEMMEHLGEKDLNEKLDEAFSREDIMWILSNIQLQDTFTEEQATEFAHVIQTFYYIALDMGMSRFIARSAIHGLVDFTCNVCDKVNAKLEESNSEE